MTDDRPYKFLFSKQLMSQVVGLEDWNAFLPQEFQNQAFPRSNAAGKSDE
ncbi:MAG TPA: hypothetical protein VJ873_10100 [bacterium]|nr:hypothetical protein [bacterium]